MKRILLLVALMALMLTLNSCTDNKEIARVEKLNTFLEQYSYAAGMNIAESLTRMDTELDIDLIAQGLRDGFAGVDLLLTTAERDSVMLKLAEQLRARDSEKQSAQAADNQAAGERFLAENAGRENIVVTASGLQYIVMEEGEGDFPGINDKVTVNYRGTLIDGTEFDSSYKRGQPATFPVGGVIKGWIEGMQLMKVGSKFQFFIPSELAYGEHGAGAMIGPNAALIFEVELLSIEKGD